MSLTNNLQTDFLNEENFITQNYNTNDLDNNFLKKEIKVFLDTLLEHYTDLQIYRLR